MSKLISADEAAAYLGVSRDTVYRLAKERKIPAARIGRSLKFSVETLDAWLADCMRVEPATPPTPTPPTPPPTRRGEKTYPGPQRPGYVPIHPVPKDLPADYGR